MTARDARPSSLQVGARQLGSRELGPRHLAGYRVLRSLARDQDAEVLLGHRRAVDSSDEVLTVAIKTSSASDAGWSIALTECGALERARGDHVVDLLDLDADGESIRLIFERLPRGDLAELLRVRPRFDAGEAVTVLAPIVVALLRMHEAGVAHGNLSARSVLFRADGAPTLIGFSRAELFEPGAPEVVLEHVEAVRRDRAATRSLAAAVLGRVGGARLRDVQELMTDIAQRDDELVLPLLASRLFEVAAALPVRFEEPDEPEADVPPSKWRAIPVGVPDDASTAAPVASSSPGLAAAVARLVPESLVQRVLDAVERGPAAPVLAAALGRWASWTPGRRRVVLAAAAAAATIGIVTATVPAGAIATGAPGSAGSPSASRSAAPGGSASSGPTSADDRGDVTTPAVNADDPVAAASSLVKGRDRCLNSLSLRCLHRVDEAGSSALNDDQAAIRVAQRGGELPDPLPGETSDGSAVLIERLGDSALVRLGQAASSVSLLLVKGDEGWRIRDVIVSGAAVDATPTPTPTDG